jgi:hypothetical protein
MAEKFSALVSCCSGHVWSVVPSFGFLVDRLVGSRAERIWACEFQALAWL